LQKRPYIKIMPFIDFPRLLDSIHVPYKTSGAGISRDFIGIYCPFCSNPHGPRGGFSLDKGFYSCWRCGHHKLVDVIKALARCTEKKAYELIQAHKTNNPAYPLQDHSFERNSSLRGSEAATGTLKLPGNELSERHRKYLLDRNFDPDYLMSRYGVRGVGPVGDFKWRIIIPIKVGGQIISYQGRDITKMSIMKYRPCPKELELIPYKNCLYELDSCGKKLVVVEGVMKVWRLGIGSTATFGIKYTQEQVKRIVEKKIEKAFVLFDNGFEAQRQAGKMANDLNCFGIETEIITLLKYDDPDNMPNDEAKQLMRDLLG
jgi:hypothetical protein